MFGNDFGFPQRGTNKNLLVVGLIVIGIAVVLVVLYFFWGDIRKGFERRDLVAAREDALINDISQQTSEEKIKLLEQQVKNLQDADRKHRREIDNRKKRNEQDKETIANLRAENGACKLSVETIKAFEDVLENHDVPIPWKEDESIWRNVFGSRSSERLHIIPAAQETTEADSDSGGSSDKLRQVQI